MTYRKTHIYPKLQRLRKRESILKNPSFWIWIFVVIVIGVGVYFIVFSSQFQISDIDISGNEQLTNVYLQDQILTASNQKIFSLGFLRIWSKSIFLVNTNNIKEDVLKKFPIIDSVELQKSFPHKLAVQIKERQPYATVCQGSLGNCFVVDRQGIVFDVLTQISPELISLKNVSVNKEVVIGESVANSSIMDGIFKIQETLKNDFEVKVETAFISNPLILTTSENWQIYLDPEADLNLQAEKLTSLLKNQIPIEVRKKLQYIYLQYKDRAYYK